MKPILTRCGYRCDLCLAYRPNIEKHPENRQKLSDGWHRYFGFRIPASEICCDGCMAENPHLIDQGCPVRPCVIERELENCAQCEDYICERLKQRLVTYDGVKERVAEEIPEDDYNRFIRPYENKRRLDALRAFESKEEAMFSGLLLMESLKDESILDLVRITKTEVWDVQNAADWQPRRWTAISFEGESERADEVARALSRAMKPAWYANLSTETHAYVVFAGKVFKYIKGDARVRAKAQAYALSAGVPESQVDWGE